MRVGLLTSYHSHEKGLAWITLPIMHRYCSIRGYTLVVGHGLSPEAMFEGVNPTLDPQYETATLFLPIRSVIVDPRVTFHNLGKGQETPPPGLAIECNSIEEVRECARKAAWLAPF